MEQEPTAPEKESHQPSMRTKMTAGFAAYFVILFVMVAGFTPQLLDAWRQLLEGTAPEAPGGIVRIATLGRVVGATYSPGGDLIAVSTTRGPIIYNASSRQIVADLRGAPLPIEEIAWSPTGDRIAGISVAVKPESLYVWDIGRGEEIFSAYLNMTGLYFSGYSQFISWSPDGGKIAIPILNGAGIWDARTGEALTMLESPDNLTNLAWSPTGRYLAGSTNAELLIWDLEKEETRRYNGTSWSQGISTMRFSPDGRLAVSVWGPEIGIIDPDTGTASTIRYSENPNDMVGGMVWSPDNTRLAVSGEYVDPSKAVGIYDFTKQSMTYLKGCNACGASQLAWTKDSAYLAVAGWDLMLYVYGFSQDGPRLSSSSQPFPEGVQTVSWSPSGDRMLCKSYTTSVAEVTREGEVLERLGEYTPSLSKVVWSPDASLTATAGSDKAFTVWNATNGQAVCRVTGALADVSSLAWSPREEIAVAWANDKVCVMRIPSEGGTAEIIKNITLILDQGANPGLDLEYSPDGSLLAICQRGWPDGEILAYDTATWNRTWEMKTFPNPTMARWSPDGELLATLSWKYYKGWHYLIDVFRRDGKRAWQANTTRGRAIAWSNDGEMFASVGSGISIYDRSGQLVGEVVWEANFADGALSVEWFQNSTCLATGHRGGAIRIWNATDHAGLVLERTHRIHSWGVTCLRKSPVADVIATASSDGLSAYPTAGQLLGEAMGQALPAQSAFVPRNIIPLEKAQPEPEPEPGIKVTATNLRVLWRLDTGALGLGQSHQSSPTVADIDKDGRNEILLGFRQQNRLLCATETGEVKWIFPPLDKPELGGNVLTSTTLIDLDGDGRLEILFARRGGAVHCLNADGQEVWRFDLGGTLGAVTAEPQIYDNDGDGEPEIYVAAAIHSSEVGDTAGYLYQITKAGEVVWAAKFDGYTHWPPVVWDIDQDGSGEIVACLSSANVTCVDAGTGKEKWRYPVQGGGLMRSTPVAADVDRDGRYEVVVPAEDGNLHILSEYGKPEWICTTPTNGQLVYQVPVGDIDGDGNLEASFMDDELVYCVDLYTHQTEWTYKPSFANHYSNYNLFADVTGDGQIDVILVAPDLVVLSNGGKVEAAFDTSLLYHEKRAENGPWVGDLNQDGIVEILVKFDGDGLYCLSTDARYNPGLMIWPKSLQNLLNRPVVTINPQ